MLNRIIGMGWEEAGGDLDVEVGLVERPRVDLEEGGGGAGEGEFDRGRAGVGVEVLGGEGGRLSAADGEGEEVHGLEEAEVEAEEVFGRIGVEGESVGEREVSAEVELFAEQFVAFEFVVLELVE
jgi:hypothetical protein